MPIVTETGFQTEPNLSFRGVEALAENCKNLTLDVDPDTEVDVLSDAFSRIDLIRVHFDSFADGRGFSLGRRLRNAGYRGRLRAAGHLISDQFRYALECGFDDVEISDALATRQPEHHWIADAPARPTYREKLSDVSARLPEAQHAADRARSALRPVSLYKPLANVHEQVVTQVTHYTDGLFSFRISRPSTFRFRSGEFVMIGLPNAERPVFRAYSLAGPSWDDELEFYSIKVPDGPLTQHLQRVEVGDTVLVKKKATGTLVMDALLSGKRLFLFSTGTGIAPFTSIIRDPETYEKFEQVVLTQTCRTQAELEFGLNVVAETRGHELLGDIAGPDKLVHFTTLTRDDHPHTGRITTLLKDGHLFDAIGMAPIDAEQDRAMLCGSMDMLRDTGAICEQFGLVEGSNSRPGTYVVERAFVD